MNGRRRIVRGLCGSLLVAPLAAKAQPATRIRRIGVLSPGPAAAAEFQDVVEMMGAFGWIEGKNIALEPRSAMAKLDRLRALASDLAALKVDVIVTYGTEAAAAAKSATTTIPIVMVSGGDPVSTGLVASLAHPGGNITGYSFIYSVIVGKQAALLHELLPTVRRVCVLINPVGPTTESLRRAKETAYRSLGLQPIFIEVAAESQFLGALAEALRLRAELLDFAHLSLPMPGAHMQAVRRSQLPALVADREDVEAGGLMSFAPDLTEGHRRVAVTIDKILRGAKPADLPVEQPTRFELVINLTVAKALGITVPRSILMRADQVIQ
jgi:putative tryptophan/tyrosine transport system substrate-binding protein